MKKSILIDNFLKYVIIILYGLNAQSLEASRMNEANVAFLLSMMFLAMLVVISKILDLKNQKVFSAIVFAEAGIWLIIVVALLPNTWERSQYQSEQELADAYRGWPDSIYELPDGKYQCLGPENGYFTIDRIVEIKIYQANPSDVICVWGKPERTLMIKTIRGKKQLTAEFPYQEP